MLPPIADLTPDLAERLPLPGTGAEAGERPYGARTDAGVIVGDLLMRHVPALARGDLEIVAIARRPTVLTKVAVRGAPALVCRSVRSAWCSVSVPTTSDACVPSSATNRCTSSSGIGEPARYVAEALGLGYVPPMTLLEAARRADVLLGDIDYRGVRGWQAVNVLLASALTEWRIRLKRIASSPAWRLIEAARVEGRSVPAEVTSRLPKGLSVSIYGLHALLPTGRSAGFAAARLPTRRRASAPTDRRAHPGRPAAAGPRQPGVFMFRSASRAERQLALPHMPDE